MDFCGRKPIDGLDYGDFFLARQSAFSSVRAGAPGTPAFNPSWYAQSNIYWDPAGTTGGNDANSGITSSSPLLTFAEIYRRYGAYDPILNYGQNVTAHQLSAQPASIDPVYFMPRLSGGGYAALLGTLVVFSASAVRGAVTLLNKAAGTDLQLAGMPVGTTAGMIVHNDNTGSYAFIESMNGTTATLTQPLTDASITTIGLPAPANGTNWLSTDNYTIYSTPNSTNLLAWRPVGGDVVGSAASVGWTQWVQIADASGTGAAEYGFIGDCASNVLSGCYIVPRLNMGSNQGRGFTLDIIGCFVKNLAILYSGEIQSSGTYFAGAVTANSGLWLFDATNCTVQGATQTGVGGGAISITSLHIVGTLSVSQNTSVTLGSATGTIFGAGGITVFSNAQFCLSNAGNTFVNGLLNTGALQMGTNTTGSTYNNASGAWTAGINITPANLDANGGLCRPLMGAHFALQTS